jgi:hypothetical protein
MKAIEFTSQVRNNSIRVPQHLSSELSGSKNLRVIVLYEEDDPEEDDFQNLSQEQFIKGYSESDSIYDKE